MILRTIIDYGILTTNPSTCIVPALQDHHGGGTTERQKANPFPIGAHCLVRK